MVRGQQSVRLPQKNRRPAVFLWAVTKAYSAAGARVAQKGQVLPFAFLPDRDDAIRKAFDSGGYGLKAIGEHFGLHYSRVSRIVNTTNTGRKAKGKT